MSSGGSRYGSRLVIVVASLLLLTSLSETAEARRRRHRIRRAPAVPALTELGLPNVRSASALVVDMDSGTILFGKDPDAVRAIASTGKIFVALAVRRRGLDLEGTTEITLEDAQYARGGSRTHLAVGLSWRNGDLLRAMLVASDNRAVTAVGRAAGLSPDELVQEMNAVARDLGLRRTSFIDPTGLNGNWSTAREMAMGLAAALHDRVLAEILATKFVSIHSVGGRRVRTIHYANTNRVLHRDSMHVLGGKTGFTDDAGYCLVTGVEMNERRIAFVFLGGDGELTRFADFNRVVGWMEFNRGGGGVAVTDLGVGTPAMQSQKTEDSR
jgi:D-alanyl-D-alanine endopeptidase (penicillin-binding protein 7)